jgi:hypothetical protein
MADGGVADVPAPRGAVVLGELADCGEVVDAVAPGAAPASLG